MTMPTRTRIARLSWAATLVCAPAYALAQQLPSSPEPSLEPAPRTQAPRGDRLPPLEPPAPDDDPRTLPTPRQPLRSTPRPAESLPTPAPVAEEVIPDGPRRVIEMPPQGPKQVIEMPPRGEVIEDDDDAIVAGDAPVAVMPSPVAAPAVVAPVVPIPSVVWINGHFERKPDTVEYVPGRWEKPLIGAPRYYAPKYVTRRGRVVWVEGHWAQAATPAVAIARPAPVVTARPAPVVTARPVQPAPVPVATARPVAVDPGVRVVQSQAVVRPAPAPMVVSRPATVVQPATVVTPTAVVTPAPAPAVVVPGQWRQGLFGNWKYIPGRVVY
jgi:hypothetical protein